MVQERILTNSEAAGLEQGSRFQQASIAFPHISSVKPCLMNASSSTVGLVPGRLSWSQTALTILETDIASVPPTSLSNGPSPTKTWAIVGCQLHLLPEHQTLHLIGKTPEGINVACLARSHALVIPQCLQTLRSQPGYSLGIRRGRELRPFEVRLRKIRQICPPRIIYEDRSIVHRAVGNVAVVQVSKTFRNVFQLQKGVTSVSKVLSLEVQRKMTRTSIMQSALGHFERYSMRVSQGA